MERKNSIYTFENIPKIDYNWPDWYYNSIEKLKGRCIWCGGELPKRKRKYCSKKSLTFSCKWEATWWAAYDLNVTSLRRFIHKKFNFECQECGKHLSEVTPAGVELPYHMGHVHHIEPLYRGGRDKIDNMTLLCSDCHLNKHKKHI